MTVQPNSVIWKHFERTDPKATVAFQNGNGFKGTSIKPIYIIERLTNFFGPCGTSWGTEQPHFEIFDGANDERIVQCVLQCWYMWNGEKKILFGVGGNKILTYVRGNKNHDEYWTSDDDGFKKAYTDALTNAFKLIGIGADIHGGVFDQSKYTANERKQDIETNPHNQITGQAEPAAQNGMQSIAQLKRSGVWKEMCTDINQCTSIVSLRKVANYWSDRFASEKWPKFWIDNARDQFVNHRDFLKHGLLPDEEPERDVREDLLEEA